MPFFAVIEIELTKRLKWAPGTKFGPQGEKQMDVWAISAATAMWGASDCKATRSRPVKCVGEPDLSVDGMFQAEKDGGVGLQRKDA